MKKPTMSRSGRLLALAGGAVSPFLLSVNLVAQTAAEPAAAGGDGTAGDADLVVLDKFEVTGSRIKRVDTESVSPVVQLHSSELALTGYTSIGDMLRTLPFNSGQALVPADSGNSFTPGVSTLNLRGLGNNSTLVLINGRRSAPYAAPGFDGFQTVFDMNSIPDAAIESVEILKDGGSALYGSDAVGGVVNFRFRRDYQGADARFTVGNYYDTDGLLLKGSLVAGTTNGTTSVVATVQWEHQDAVLARDLSYTRDADKTSVAAKADPQYRGSGWAAAGFSSEQEYLDQVYADLADYGITGDVVADGWFDNRSSRGFPGYVYAPAGTDDDGNTVYGVWTFEAATATPTLADAVYGANYYNYQETSGLFPEHESAAFYTNIRHEFSELLYVFADLSYSRTHSKVYAAPTPVDLASENSLEEGTSMYIPAENAYNPWGVDITTGSRRLVELAGRLSDVTSKTPRLVAGLGGKLAGLRDWTWETGALYSRNKVDTVSKNAVSDTRLQEALLGLTEQSDGSLAWDPSTPQSERVYFNWFGTNSEAMADFLAIENPTSASLRYLSFDVSATGSLCDLPAGKLGLAVGAETRQERFESVRSALNAAGDIVGGDEGTSSHGSRRVTAAYAEIDIPVVKQFEVSAAGRFEKYSDDGFAQSVRPKLGLKFRPVDWLVLRGSYSKSFKAPDLAYLYTSNTTTFTSNSVYDPVLGAIVDGLEIHTVGNPDLQPELTDTYYLGLAFEPTKGALKGLQLSADWFRYEQKNLLAQLSDYYGYATFIAKAAQGDPLFAGKVIRSADTGEILYINDNYENLSTGLYEGMDFAASYAWETAGWGAFILGAQATWVDKLRLDDDDFAGSSLVARFNATLNAGWRLHDWEVNVYEVYRGARTATIDLGSVYTDDDNLYIEYTVKPQYTTNVAVTYSGFRKYKITAAVTNVFNQTPPVDPWEATGTTPGVNDLSPAFWTLTLEREF